MADKRKERMIGIAAASVETYAVFKDEVENTAIVHRVIAWALTDFPSPDPLNPYQCATALTLDDGSLQRADEASNFVGCVQTSDVERARVVILERHQLALDLPQARLEGLRDLS